MPTVHVPADRAQDVAKRMLFLAWKACGRSFGMGFLQDRGPDQTEDQVWQSAVNRDDYQGIGRRQDNRVYADYVQGRMMKLGLSWGEVGVTCFDGDSKLPWSLDYQGFAGTFPNFEALARAACEELNIPIDKID